MQVSVSGGDISPLVGHNAFLRWSAVKECAFTDAADGKMKYWSEAHVSEDFDLAMRFQVDHVSQIVHSYSASQNEPDCKKDPARILCSSCC